jgi:hypothetical protein
MRRTLGILLAAAFLATLAFTLSDEKPVVTVPNLPIERNQFGGRPGTFHFVTNEQTMADARALQEAFASVDRLEANLAGVKEKDRAPLSADVRTLRAFLLELHRQRAASAGATAQEVELRLNAAKGNFMCGGCHGHAMMHGGMRGGRGPMGGPGIMRGPGN